MTSRRKPTTLRHVAQWRRVTARLQVLMNHEDGSATLASEVHSLCRQCERMAAELRRLMARDQRHQADKSARVPP